MIAPANNTEDEHAPYPHVFIERDLDYTITLLPDDEEFGMGRGCAFRCYEIAGYQHADGDEPGAPSLPIYGDLYAVSGSSKASPNPSSGGVFLHGHLRYNGCCNFMFEPGYLHVCSQLQAIHIGTLLGQVYERARELVPTIQK